VYQNSGLENLDFTRLLEETADLMEIGGLEFRRINAYRKGAAAIESYHERVADLMTTPGRSVTEIPGVGKGIEAVLKELAERGSFDVRDEMLAKFPAAALDFLKIQGLGPKSIALIFEHFQITTMDELAQLCKDHKLQSLPRMGAKLEEKHCSN